ncbi:hypothetical protein LUZ60_000974 [Juncus effusus]|nr:hypothetical protein LUZ60_000974 [Juncus effusus]
MGFVFGKVSLMKFFGFFMLCRLLGIPNASAKTRHYMFMIEETPFTRLCHTKNMLTVNGQYPGPTIYAHKGDNVLVNVINNGNKNVTLHWHGVNEPRDPWSDGPEYVTQCPIQPGSNFTQRIQFTEEEGTLWWHAHTDFDRATLYGAIVVYPRPGTTFPFPKPHKEFTLLLGEWWNEDVTLLLEKALGIGGDIQPSDANTINGQPGDLLPCSRNDTFKVQVEQGKTYLIRLVNAALSNEFFFAIANHNLTIIGSDASYTKPYTTDFIMITPGQSMDILLEANQLQNTTSPSLYYIAARPYDGNIQVRYDGNFTTAVLEYKTNCSVPSTPFLPSLPNLTDTNAAEAFSEGLRSLASWDHPIDVPKNIDEHMYITVSINEVLCPGRSCIGPHNNKVAASLNNVSFQNPRVDVLEAYYYSIPDQYTPDFPNNPELLFNFTEGMDLIPPKWFLTTKSTKVKILEYNTTVEIVLQGTNFFVGENHPMHLHGHSFYVIGKGFGIFDKEKDPLTYNLVDPPYVSTFGVPKNGWAAIRFRAANPGVWFMHCHLDRHAVWGMDMVFITKNGEGENEKILPPPRDMPRC